MSDPMTLRDAVDRIVGKSDELLPSRGRDDLDRLAIRLLDAAVKAHEARQALESLPIDPADTGFDWHTEPMWEAWKKADDKLRALERGESEGKP